VSLNSEYKKWAKTYKQVDNMFSIPKLVYDSFEAGFKLGASSVKPPNQEVTVDAVLLTCETCPLEYDPTCENYLCD